MFRLWKGGNNNNTNTNGNSSGNGSGNNSNSNNSKGSAGSLRTGGFVPGSGSSSGSIDNTLTQLNQQQQQQFNGQQQFNQQQFGQQQFNQYGQLQQFGQGQFSPQQHQNLQHHQFQQPQMQSQNANQIHMGAAIAMPIQMQPSQYSIHMQQRLSPVPISQPRAGSAPATGYSPASPGLASVSASVSTSASLSVPLSPMSPSSASMNAHLPPHVNLVRSNSLAHHQQQQQQRSQLLQSPSQSPSLNGSINNGNGTSEFRARALSPPQQISRPPTTASAAATTNNSNFINLPSPSPRPPIPQLHQQRQLQQQQLLQQQQQQQQQQQGPDLFIPVPTFFVRFASLITPYVVPIVPAEPSQAEIVDAITKYLISIQMPPKDISFSRTPPNSSSPPGFIVRVSSRGIKTLERAVETKRVESAAIVLQKHWRGRSARILFKRELLDRKKKTDAAAAAAAAVAATSNALSTALVSNPAGSPRTKRSSMADERRSSLVIDGAEKSSSERAERRKSKVNAFKTHLLKISNAYEEIINANVVKESDDPSEDEVEFMHIMNTDETFRLSLNLRAMHKLERTVTLDEAQRNYEQQGGVPGRSPAQMYHDYSPRVVEWIITVLSLPPTHSQTNDLVTLLRPADILCLLAIQMFPHVQCKLLNKGPEFTIHKAVFFLELCKTVGVKPGMLFSLKDLFLGGEIDDPTRKSGLTVLRTVCALERQARRRGWDGPVMVLKIDRTSVLKGPGDDGAAVVIGGGQRGSFGNDAEAAVLTMSSLTKRGSKMGRSGGSGSGAVRGSYLEGKEGKRKSGMSSRSSQDSMSMRNSRIATQQQYFTSLPSNFKSLSRDEKVAFLVALPVIEARESLRILYAAQHEKFEYEDLMAVVWEKEHADIVKQGEHDKRVHVAVQVREAVAKRNDAVRALLAHEESHLFNLSNLSMYLENTSNYRLRLQKRRSRGLSTAVQLSASKTVDIFAPQSQDESEISAVMRVETENEELVLLDGVVKEIIAIHQALVEELKFHIEVQETQDGGVIAIGEGLMRFGNDSATPYITYSTVALGAKSIVYNVICGEENEPFEDENGQPSVTFANSVVGQFVGEGYKQLVEAGSIEAVADSIEDKVQELKWYLSQPLLHFTDYEALFDEINRAGAVEGEETRKSLSKLLVDDNDIGVEWRRLVKEERKLEVVGVKVGSVSKAIVGKVEPV
ncbi:hypothetical protein HK100_009411 [Physocladia obscura]|uniref:DH domain-containing protein n=1 Tax=Physocladia obscura TaxID=109957 RepID=A0AAD5T629_9FUNG|nr:hypothetical protein HK100_009411 [Physocladia obscura]